MILFRPLLIFIILLLSSQLYAQDIFTYIGKSDLTGVKKCIDNGVDINLLDYEYGQTALMISSRAGNLDIVKYLVEQGADLNILAESEWGWTALIEASFGGHIEVVKILVESGADINIQDVDSASTALMIASRLGNLDIVQYLVENGAKINVEDFDGKIIPVLNYTSEHQDIIDYLKSKGAK